MTANAKMDRIRELVEILNASSRAYYQSGGGTMSDFEYDRLYDELAELEAETGVVLDNSPTRGVGYEVLSGLVKSEHETPMLSLDKTKDDEKLAAFLGDKTGVLSWKLDGLAIEVVYKGGVLVSAVTRGNGYIGENITHNARTFVNLPEKIAFHGELAVRGEAVISFKDFERINESLTAADGVKYKNPRNLCSGTVRQLDSKIAAARPVHFIAYSVRKAEDAELDSRLEYLDMLKRLGFTAVSHKAVTSRTVLDALREFKDAAPHGEFATDGLVLAFDSLSFGKSLGETSKFPRDSIAFKWADETADTVLLEVEWNTSRTGLINPVAVFEPVELEGTVTQRASLHNVSVFESFALGRGDTLSVYKANMIIPQIAENLTRSGGLDVPEICPVCGRNAEVRQNGEAKALFCNNPNCRARAVGTIAHFCSRDAMNIEGLSEQTIEKFTDAGYLAHYGDIYSLYRFEDDIKAAKGFGQKSYDKLYAAIERSKKCFLHSFIYGLGISNVGLANAKLLCRYFDYDIEKIISAAPGDIVKIPGFGQVIANALSEYFSDEANLKIMRGVIGYLDFIKPGGDNRKPLDGKTFVITGDLTRYENRSALTAVIEENGGSVAGSVSRKTAFLINNDIHSESRKNIKARELGVTIIDEDGFAEMLNAGYEGI